MITGFARCIYNQTTTASTILNAFANNLRHFHSFLLHELILFPCGE